MACVTGLGTQRHILTPWFNVMVSLFFTVLIVSNIIDMHTRARPPPDRPDLATRLHAATSNASAAHGQSACRSWSLEPPYWGD